MGKGLYGISRNRNRNNEIKIVIDGFIGGALGLEEGMELGY